MKIKAIQFLGFGAILLQFVACSTTSQNEHEPRTLSPEEKARMLVGIANGSLIEGNPTQALKSLLEAERLDSAIPELHHSKALAYFQKKKLAEARDSAETAVKLNPKFTAAVNTLGKIYLRTGQVKLAKPLFIRALKDPLYTEVYKPLTNLGIAYYREKNWDLASKHFKRAIEGHPELACVAHYYRGHLAYRKKDWKSASLSYRRATQKLCAKFPEAHFSLAMTYLKAKRYDEARKKFLEIADLFPNHKITDQAMLKLRKIP